MQECKEFIKPKHSEFELTNAIPRSFMKYNFSKLLLIIQKYFTCEGRYHKVYSYHFKLLLHFVGKKYLDLPFYLYRSLAKMAYKVQAKSEGSETSLFHHGLINLLVLDELKRLGRDWSSFLFVSGFEVDAITPKRTPKPRGITSPSVVEQSEPVGPEQSEPIILETEQLQKLHTPIVSPTKQKLTMRKPTKKEPTVSKHDRKRITRSQTVAKGNLEDFLHAIDI